MAVVVGSAEFGIIDGVANNPVPFALDDSVVVGVDTKLKAVCVSETAITPVLFCFDTFVPAASFKLSFRKSAEELWGLTWLREEPKAAVVVLSAFSLRKMDCGEAE